MRRSFNITTSDETVALSDAKKQLNVQTTDDDDFIAILVTAAREVAEAETKLDLVPKSVVMYLNDFPAGDSPIELLDHGPMRSITSIVYLDTDGTEVTLSTGDYNIDIYTEPPSIYPDYSTSWPSVYPYTNSPANVTVTWASGYTTATLPQAARAAQHIIIADMYENRESGVVGTIAAMAKVSHTAKMLLAQIASPVV